LSVEIFRPTRTRLLLRPHKQFLNFKYGCLDVRFTGSKTGFRPFSGFVEAGSTGEIEQATQYEQRNEAKHGSASDV
jgi:hypothetical protein